MNPAALSLPMWWLWTGRVLSGLPVLLLLLSASMKLSHPPMVVATFVGKLGYRPPPIRDLQTPMVKPGRLRVWQASVRWADARPERCVHAPYRGGDGRQLLLQPRASS